MKRMAVIAVATPLVLAGTVFADVVGASSDSPIVLAQSAETPTASPPAPTGADISTTPSAAGGQTGTSAGRSYDAIGVPPLSGRGNPGNTSAGSLGGSPGSSGLR